MIQQQSQYINPWIFKEEIVNSETIKPYFGFIYLLIDQETNKKYIGRKYLWCYKKIKNKIKRQKQESDWKKYYSSNEELKQIGKINPMRIKREILYLCKSKGETNFREIEEQFKRNVLYSKDYLNDNINGKWFSKNVEKYFN